MAECPKCGVVNASLRLTCIACGSSLAKEEREDTSQSVLNPPEKTSGPEIKSRRKRGKGQRKQRSKRTPITQPETKIPREPAKDKPARKRHGRRKKRTAAIEVFMLQDGKLVPVTMISTTKKVKPSPLAKSLITLWNRNKGLLK